MIDAKILLHEIVAMQADISTVLLCHPETKKIIEQNADVPPNVFLIENNHVEKNQAFLVKDLNLKRALLDGYFIGKEQLKGAEEKQ